MLDAGADEVDQALDSLRKQGRVYLDDEYHVKGWTSAGDTQSDIAPKQRGEWLSRLAEYALVSPGATLPEMMIAIGSGTPTFRDRVVLLLSALREAEEFGEFRLLTYLIMEIMGLDREGLREGEMAEVLRVFEPRRLRGYSVEKAEDFLLDILPVMRDPGGRALAVTRLGELELLRNRSASAEEHLREALDLSIHSGSCTQIPAILESLGEIPRDYQAMSEIASEVERVLQWVSGIDDPDAQARVTAAAALAQSSLKMSALAERTILSAMTRIATLPLETQLAVEWSRARIYMSSGRRKAAMTMLQRALMLAESVNDQLAVMEILNTIVGQMRERSGFTVRDLLTIMRNVSRKARTSGNLSNRMHALDQLADMYTRTLQLSKAAAAAGELQESAASLKQLSTGFVSEWHLAYIGFLTGEDSFLGRGEGILRGTGDFLRAMAHGEEPASAAAVIAEQLHKAHGAERPMFALVLAMEAFSRGMARASSAIAAALDSSRGGSSGNHFVSWKLCISALLSSRRQYSDDFFQSAQVLARQLDRLLLVWLILRCRLALQMDRPPLCRTEMLLLAGELDSFITDQLDGRQKEALASRSGSRDRMRELMGTAGASGGELLEIRDRISMDGPPSGPGERLLEISGISSRISGRSEISASLEILGRLMKADRVLAVRVTGGETEIIEGYGSGRWRPPGEETHRILMETPSEKTWCDSFGVTPFGSRRSLIIPLECSVKEPQRRTLLPDHSSEASFLLVETESPLFLERGIPEFIIDTLSSQVEAALSLRSRESMAYMDRLTGAVIGYSWTDRLEEMLRCQPPDSTVTVLIAGVDGMGEINRLFGYRVGDSALKAVVSTIRGTLRPNDLIGRIRGDLFGVILPDTGKENAMLVAERICGAVAGVDIRPDRVPVTVSTGVAAAESSRDPQDLVVSRAADAMGAAKSRGGNRVVLWTEDMESPDMETLRIFNTGDPGWDHAVCSSVMELLAERNPGLQLMAEKLRDALRSQLVYLEDGRGGSAFVGSRILGSISREIGSGRKGGVTMHASLLGKYDALSAGLSGGGRLISAWETSGGISHSLRNIFSALAKLSDSLVGMG
ncbi:MAG: GGDEF domain-containing protein [Candidatus Aegiribacteria sp.]